MGKVLMTSITNYQKIVYTILLYLPSMKRIISSIVVIFFIFLIYNLSKSIYSLWQKQDLLVNARQELAKEKRANESLKTQAKKVKDPDFIEKEARDKLLYVKPGEKIVVIPEKLIVEEKRIKVVEKQEPAWLQWWNLLFH